MTKRKPPEEHRKPGPKGPRVWTLEAALQLGEDLIAWQLAEAMNIYWEKYIVVERGFYPDLTGYLTGRYPEFERLIKRAKKIQEYKLAEMLGKGEIKSMFMLKNHHHYADKQEVKSESTVHQTVKDVSSLRGMNEDELKDRLRWLTEQPSKH